VITGTNVTKLDVDESYWSFKLKVKQWFENFGSSSGNAPPGQVTSVSEVSCQAESSKIHSASEPVSSKSLPE